jgi:phosphoenolpyruvate-protein phosphotransferase
MQQLDLVIHNATGLHARPAREFVDLAKRYQSTIKIGNGTKQVNAKSLIAVLTLGVGHGQHIFVEVSGDDEQEAAEAIALAVRDGLGEGPEHAQPLVAGKAEPAPVAAAPQAQAETSSENNRPENVAGKQIRGVAGAPGIAVGPIFRFERARYEVNERFAGIDHEQDRLRAALEAAQIQLDALREQVLARADASEAAIFEVHRDILSDPELIDEVHAAIAEGRSAAEAWQLATDQQSEALAQLADRLLAERAADVRDVGERVLRLLMGEPQQGPELPAEPVIIVASDLTPSETASFDPERVLGFCTAVGGPNAHTAILARALGLPAVVSAGPEILEIASGSQIVIDGTAGTLTVEPDEATVIQMRELQERYREAKAIAARSADQPATTLDGTRIEVVANIGGLADAQKAASNGAEGVGLLRTEFLFLERTEAPTEDEQFEVYRSIAMALDGLPVIIRTLDIGGDKPLPYIDLPSEENPFLGERGIRLCLNHPDLLQQQLRAILRAAPYGRLRVMFPMVADIGELRAARRMVEAIRAEFDAPPIELGIMVEVPSAAIMADVLAAEVDFFSIGTNDLTQYTLAMDRTHPSLALQADGLHPAVLRLIARTAEAAHAAGKWVGVCGELGADPVAVPILIGLGVDELSVSVPAIPTVKAQIRSLNLLECQERAKYALQCATAQQVREGNEHAITV